MDLVIRKEIRGQGRRRERVSESEVVGFFVICQGKYNLIGITINWLLLVTGRHKSPMSMTIDNRLRRRLQLNY